jgi:hypothetical protein
MAFWCNDHSWNEPEWGHDQMNQDELCNYISESIFRQRISGIGTSTAMGPPKSGGTVLEVSGFPVCCRSSSFPLTHHLITYIMLHHVTSIVIIYIWSIFDLYLIYIWSIFDLYLYSIFIYCVFYVFYVSLCIHTQPLHGCRTETPRHSEKSGLGVLTSKGSATYEGKHHVFGQSVGSFSSHFAHWFLCKVIWIILVSLCPIIFNYLSELQRLELQSQVASHIRNPRLKSIPRSPALNCQGSLRSSLITCSLTVIRCRPRLSKDTYKH